MNPDEWLQMIEMLPRSGKHVNDLRTQLQRKWVALQQQREAEHGRLSDIFRTPPGITGSHGSVIEHPEHGVFYVNSLGDLMFQRV